MFAIEGLSEYQMWNLDYSKVLDTIPHKVMDSHWSSRSIPLKSTV